MKQNENGKKIKKTIKNRMSRIRSWKSWSKRRKLTTGVGGGGVLAVVAGAIGLSGGSDTEVIYKETTVKYGTLVKGVTETGSVDIGTVDQTFDLDMSALQRTDTSGSSSSGGSSGSTAGSSSGSGGFGGMNASGGGAQGGLDMFGQIFNMGGSSSGSNGDDSTLTVAEVVVSVGQQVSEGDPLYLLEEDSVSDLEDELQSNVEKAKADLEAVEADQTLSKQQAKYTYDSSTAYGSYIDTEYSTTLQELQNTVDSAESTLEQAKSSLEDYRAQLEEVTAAYEDAAQVLSNCKYSLNSTDAADDTYGYVYYAQLTEQAQSTADSLEQQKEELEQRVEQAETAYNKAKRELEQGKLTAAETKKLRTLAYNTAQETYDIALGYLEQDLSDQQETYDETLEKWNEFSTYIDGNAVCARYNGVITSVELEAGDKISTGTSLVTLYDMDEVTMTVTVDEDDMTDISLGSAANIALTAYPEDIFTAKVTVIGDATSDSSGNITYDVTVTLEGDVSGLFQGMTADVTFVTEQTEEVLYVSRRAIITEDDKTYVKVKTAEGSIVKKEITTGLSDGSNVEISGDIAEGDTVLIESSITK